MSVNISDGVSRYLTDMTGTFNFDLVPVKTRKMIDTYATSGISRTNGIASKIAKIARMSNGLQYIMSVRDSIYGWNVHEDDVYDAIVAACTAAKLDTTITRYDGTPRFWYSVDDGPYLGRPMREFINDKPRRFNVYYGGLDGSFALKKLCDPLKIDMTKPMTINLRNI